MVKTDTKAGLERPVAEAEVAGVNEGATVHRRRLTVGGPGLPG